MTFHASIPVGCSSIPNQGIQGPMSIVRAFEKIFENTVYGCVLCLGTWCRNTFVRDLCYLDSTGREGRVQQIVGTQKATCRSRSRQPLMSGRHNTMVVISRLGMKQMFRLSKRRRYRQNYFGIPTNMRSHAYLAEIRHLRSVSHSYVI